MSRQDKKDSVWAGEIGPTRWFCIRCNYEGKNQKEMKRHLRVVHNENFESPPITITSVDKKARTVTVTTKQTRKDSDR